MIKLINILNEIKINIPGKIQAYYQPNIFGEFEDGKVYKLNLNGVTTLDGIIAVGEYSPSQNFMHFYISNWGKDKELIKIFDKRKIKYNTKIDPYNNKYLDLGIRDPKKYFEFIDSTNEIRINNPNKVILYFYSNNMYFIKIGEEKIYANFFQGRNISMIFSEALKEKMDRVIDFFDKKNIPFRFIGPYEIEIDKDNFTISK